MDEQKRIDKLLHDIRRATRAHRRGDPEPEQLRRLSERVRYTFGGDRTLGELFAEALAQDCEAAGLTLTERLLLAITAPPYWRRILTELLLVRWLPRYGVRGDGDSVWTYVENAARLGVDAAVRIDPGIGAGWGIPETAKVVEND